MFTLQVVPVTIVSGMRQSPKTDNTPQSDSAPDALIVLIRDMADTTWRMFIPIIGGVSLGVWGDRSLAAKPWLTILGMAVGIGIAILLVRAQLKRKVI